MDLDPLGTDRAVAPRPALPDAPAAPAHPDREPDREQDRGSDTLGKVLDWLERISTSTLGRIVGAIRNVVPGLDFVLDMLEVGLNVWRVSQAKHRDDKGAWLRLGASALGAAIPLAGEAVSSALTSVLGGDRDAARRAMQKLGPALRRVELDPERYLRDLDEVVPRLLTRGLDTGVRRLQDLLHGIIAADPTLTPDWVRAAAGPAAQHLEELADGTRQSLQNLAPELRTALQALARAAAEELRGIEQDAPAGSGSLQESPTRPTGTIGEGPAGRRSPLRSDEDAAVRRALTLVNEAADALAALGYRVEQNPPADRTGREADYRVEGREADCYAPTAGKEPRGIASELRGRLNRGEADRFVLDLDDWRGDDAALQRQFAEHPTQRIVEVFVIRGGRVSTLLLAF